jgi:hypothetical protein
MWNDYDNEFYYEKGIEDSRRGPPLLVVWLFFKLLVITIRIIFLVLLKVLMGIWLLSARLRRHFSFSGAERKVHKRKGS